MSNRSYTPGPWVASKTDRSIGPICNDDDQSYGMILPVAWVEFDLNPGRHQANANLIAAAPELLEVLQLILSYHEDGNCQLHKEDVALARAAIAKAIGEEE
ncbi:hypothetical protein ACMSY0_004180 [Cronobacter sakazakii]